MSGQSSGRSTISTSTSPDERRFNARGRTSASNPRNLAIDVLPQRIQITLGGGPKRSSMRTKSWSFVTTTAFATRAASNT